MPNARNEIFRKKWVGIDTGWNYQLDIILPAEGYATGDTPFLDNPTIIDLPAGAVIVKSLGWSKYEFLNGQPIGLPNPGILKLSLDFNLLKETQFNDLTTVLLENQEKYVIKDNLFESVNYRFIAFDIANGSRGITFMLYIGNTLYFIGSYQANAIAKLNMKGFQIDIEAIDINKIILDNIKNSYAHFLGVSYELQEHNYNMQLGIRVQEFEYTHSVSGKNYRVISNTYKTNDPRQYCALSITNISKLLTDVGREIYKRLVRLSPLNWSIELPVPNCYKQLETESGELGALLNDDEIYLLTEITDNPEVVAGAFYSDVNSSNYTSIFSIAKNGLWDFINEWYRETFAQGYTTPRGINTDGLGTGYQLIGMDLANTQNGNLILRNEPVKSITASLYEKSVDTNTSDSVKKYEDIDHYDKRISGSSNEGSETFAIIFNNLPPQLKYDKINYGDGSQLFHREGAHNLGLYYFNNTYLERVHEWCQIPFRFYENINKSSDDYCTHTIVDRDIQNGHLYENIQEMQVYDGLPNIVAQTALALTGRGNHLIEDIEINATDKIWGAQDYKWWLPQYRINNTFDFVFQNLLPIEPPGDIYAKWKMNNCEVDLIKEKIKCSFIALNI